MTTRRKHLIINLLCVLLFALFLFGTSLYCYIENGWKLSLANISAVIVMISVTFLIALSVNEQ